MSHAERTPMTPEEFLAWEAKQDRKWEFDGFRPVAMTGGTMAHVVIQANLMGELHAHLKGKPCRPMGSDAKVEIGSSYRYPDAMVTCMPFLPTDKMAPEPVVVFEILSDSTARTDRTTKMAGYQSLPSLQHYVLLEQDQPFVTIISRMESGWQIGTVRDGAVMALPAIGVAIPVADLYTGLDLPPLDDA